MLLEILVVLNISISLLTLWRLSKHPMEHKATHGKIIAHKFVTKKNQKSKEHNERARKRS